MTTQKKYEKIEKNILKYSDLLKVNEIDMNFNNEKFVKLPIDMTAPNQEIFIRESVLKKLLRANEILQKINKDLYLIVLEGYRSLEKQKKQFEEVLKNLKKSFLDEIELYENAHKMIAVPEVAGHPTGGAVDVCIFNKKTNKMLDFGTQWKEFNAGKRNFTLSPEISVKAKNNRLLLKKIMEKVGFYQFPGEWWHFSFGDREWAAAHNKTKSLYQQIELTMSL